MASRRLRIKPVANVPIRRGRTTENVEKVESETEQPKEHKPEDKVPLAISNDSSSEKADQNSEQCNQPCPSQDSSTAVNDKATDNDSIKENSQVGVAKPPLLARKRVRPAVNIAAVSRASKPQNVKANIAVNVPSASSENNPSEMQNADNKGNNVIETDTASDMQLDAEDDTNANTDKALSLNNTAGTQNADGSASKEQKPARRHLKPAVNIAALSRSSRHQKGNSLTADREARKLPFSITGITELSAKVNTQKHEYEKELMTTDESLPNDAELPAESADISGESSSSHSKSTISCPKYRLAKPVPQIKETQTSIRGDAISADDYSSKRSAIPGSASAGESDDDRSLSLVSTISPPPKIARLSSGAAFGQSKGSASESDDDGSKRTLGSASTITPPTKRILEVARENKGEKYEKRTMKPRVLSSSAVRFRKARMEFYSKFNGTTTIDRSRLTMMDLIFYNPVTNPMKSSENKLSESSDKQPSAQVVPPVTEETEERLAEERADDPEGEEEEVALPVPQVKVGPDGQIVLDERSLVIETTGAKKSREDLANSAVIVDTGTTGNGFYSKKFTKYKEWSKQETLKFYRALNIIGTDFLVMQSIFPKRSRRDLKMKFKREERINRLLVEKALRNPLDFDLTELEKELAKEEEEEERRKKETQRLKTGKEKIIKEKKSKISQRNRSFLSRCMSDEDAGQVEKKRRMKKKTASSKYKKQPTMSSESDEENETDSHNPHFQSGESIENGAVEDTLMEAESSLVQEGKSVNENVDSKYSEEDEDNDDDDEEIKKELQFLTRPPRPTRSGRIPQQKHPLSIPSPNSKPAPKQSKPVQPLQDLSNIEPGSLVVIATQSPTNPGHQVYKVFMVAPPSQSGSAPAIAPVALSPKIMQSSAEQTNLQLYNSETLSFAASTQAACPATPPPNASNSLRYPCSTTDVNLHSPACSQMQPTSLESNSRITSSPNQELHDLSQSSPLSKCTTSASDLQPSSTEALSEDTHFVPISKAELHTADVNSQNMAIPTSEDLLKQVSQSDSTFIPISCPQNLSPCSHQAKILESPKPDTVVPNSLPPAVCSEHIVSSETGEQLDRSPVKDAAPQNSPTSSTIKSDSPQCTPSSPNCAPKVSQIYNSPSENTEGDNNAR